LEAKRTVVHDTVWDCSARHCVWDCIKFQVFTFSLRIEADAVSEVFAFHVSACIRWRLHVTFTVYFLPLIIVTTGGTKLQSSAKRMTLVQMFVSHRSWSDVRCALTRGVLFDNRRNLKLRDHLQNTGVVARIVLRWVFKE
jgi:hypothetical protein